MLDTAQPAARVHVRALLTPMTDEQDAELIAWAAGYLAGWDRGTDPDNLEWFDRTEQIKEAFRRSESAGRRKAWDAAVLRGENPTPHETETPS